MGDRGDGCVRGEAVVDLAREIGFPLVGVVPAEPVSVDDESRLREWLAGGEHGEMGYLAETVEARVDPRRVLEGARSMVVVGEQYWRRNEDAVFREGGDERSRLKSGRGALAGVVRWADYHRKLKKRLFGLCDAMRGRWGERLATADDPAGREGFRAVVDTAPVMERAHARRAGIGWVGKHTLMIHPRRGSYLFLGVVLTRLEIGKPKNQRETPDRCGTCARCIEACPTGAITPYSVDATKCVSYLTIEHRSEIDEGWYEGMGGWVFGCDVCQEVCPHNSPRTGRGGLVSAREEYGPFGGGAGGRTADGAGFDLLSVLGWTEEDRRAAFERSALKRASLAMMKRNALIAAGNAVTSGCGEELACRLRSRMAALASDEGEEELVRATARRVLVRLGGVWVGGLGVFGLFFWPKKGLAGSGFGRIVWG